MNCVNSKIGCVIVVVGADECGINRSCGEWGKRVWYW